jgi:hypothetical protein
MVPVSQSSIAQALELAQQAGLAAIDALHTAAARVGHTVEFITVARYGKPLFRVKGLTVWTLLDHQ